MKVLVVERDARLAARMRHAMTEYGHVADICHDGLDGLHLAMEGTYEILVLSDRSAPVTGLQILEQVRQRLTTPVMMLGELNDPEERARVLRSGADDYLVKPVAMSELLARIHALWRRRTARAPTGDCLTVADLELNLQRRQAHRGGHSLALSAQEFKLLALFARNAGAVLCRSRLREELWEESFESDSNVVEVAIRRLRSKLDRPFSTPLLHTVRGAGYVLEARHHRDNPSESSL